MATSFPRPARSVTIALVCALSGGTARADYALNLTEGVTSISREAYRLHMLALWVCVVIAILVFGAMAWSMYFHRKSRGAVAANFHDNTKVEIVWTILPFLVLVGLAIPATTALIAMHDTSNADLTIKITGQQWSWRYDYIKEDIGFVSNLDEKSAAASKFRSGVDPRSVEHYLLNVDRPVVVPVGKKVRFLLNASDVIHSWWLPDLGFKKDAIPGFVNEIWARIEKPGTYRGQCTELCGVGHGFMPIVLIAMNEPDYLAWLNYWDAMSMAATAIYRRHPFRSNDLALGFGHEDWHWNRMTLAAGHAHRPVPGTMHFKRRRSGSQMARVAGADGVSWPVGV